MYWTKVTKIPYTTCGTLGTQSLSKPWNLCYVLNMENTNFYVTNTFYGDVSISSFQTFKYSKLGK